MLSTDCVPAGVGGLTGEVCDLLDNLNIKDRTGDIEAALESLKLQVKTEHTCNTQQ